MSRTSFTAVLETDDANVVADVLGAWAKAGPLRVKVRQGGVEIDHEGPGLSIYCHDDESSPGQPPVYLLQGNMARPPQEARASLVELREAFKARQVQANLEYVEEDEDGNMLGEMAYLD